MRIPGNEDGEPFIPDRQIRINEKPLTKRGIYAFDKLTLHYMDHLQHMPESFLLFIDITGNVTSNGEKSPVLPSLIPIAQSV